MRRLGDGLYPTRLGRWLRRRLDRDLEPRPVEVRLQRGGEGLHGLRIAYLSDLHAGSFTTEDDISRICQRIAAVGPDLVCLGGDLVQHLPEQILLLGKGLSLLQPPLGVFAVPGNHEYDAQADIGFFGSFLREHGVEVLINRGVRLEHRGESFWLAGVDDLSRGRPDIQAAVQQAHEHEPIILLSHHPDFFIEAAYLGVDLTLSGHTHGGQITFFGWTPIKHTRLGFWRGHFEHEGAQLYVGRGGGTSDVPLRIHAPGEVPVIHLKTRD